jgi:cell wall-associated NlpC family hydrolase
VPVITASPEQVAQASLLEQVIVANSTVLDELSDRYNRAAADAASASQHLVEVQGKLAAANDGLASAQTKVASAGQALRRRGLEVYLGKRVQPSIDTTDPATAAYQLKIARIYGGAAIETTAQQVQSLHSAERRLQDSQQQLEASSRQAQADDAAAHAAEQQAQAAQAQALATQAKLMVAQNQVQGTLGPLVDAQRASLAVEAYLRITKAGGLPPKPILAPPFVPFPRQLPQTAQAIALAIAQTGKPYVWGAAGPASFDCSGLMQWTWAQVGIGIPRVAADQQAWVIPVPISQLLPGDLVFFGNPAHHVGMYVGNGMMVDAPHTGAFVEVTPIWWSDLAGFGRVHR